MARRRVVSIVGGLSALTIGACGLDVVGVDSLATDAGTLADTGSLSAPGSKDDAGAASTDAGSSPVTDAAGDAPVVAEPYVKISSGEVPATANLSNEGTLDWVNWDGAGSSTRKAPVVGLIGALSGTGTTSGPNYPCTFSWTDGETPSSGPTKYEYFTGGNVSFDVAASSKPRILTLYFGAYYAQVKLTASLSDGGQSASVSSLDNATSSIVGRRFVVEYAAKSSSATLKIDWSRIKSYVTGSTVSVSAAALRE